MDGERGLISYFEKKEKREQLIYEKNHYLHYKSFDFIYKFLKFENLKKILRF